MLTDVVVTSVISSKDQTSRSHTTQSVLYLCGKHCLNCKYISDGQTSYTFYSTGESRAITHHIDCNSKNVIYVIQCNHALLQTTQSWNQTTTQRPFQRTPQTSWLTTHLTNQICPACLHVLSLILSEILFLSLLLPIIWTWRCLTRKLLLL